MTVKRKSRIKCGDTVMVRTGKDRGRTGQVQRIYVQTRKHKTDRLVAIVEGINRHKKCVRANPNAGVEGGIEEREGPIDVSNLAILNTQSNRADRIGYKFLEDGTKVRVTKSDNEVISE